MKVGHNRKRDRLEEVAEYREDLFGLRLLLFRYHTVALARLPAEEYVGTSPLGAALSALMGRERTRDRARLRLSMLERVVESGLDAALMYLLVNVIETYFMLSGEDAVPASPHEKGESSRARGRAHLG